MKEYKVLVKKEQLQLALNLPSGIDVKTDEDSDTVEIFLSFDEDIFDIPKMEKAGVIAFEEISNYKRLFTEKQLDEFDKFTAMESSLNQMDRINARLDFPIWKKENHMTDEILKEMKDELILQGRW